VSLVLAHKINGQCGVSINKELTGFQNCLSIVSASSGTGNITHCGKHVACKL